MRRRGGRQDAARVQSCAMYHSRFSAEPIDYDEDRLREILSPEYFVRVRTTPGGPAAVARSSARFGHRARV